MFGSLYVGWIPPLAWMCCLPAKFGYGVTLWAGHAVIPRRSAARLRLQWPLQPWSWSCNGPPCVHAYHGTTLCIWSSCVQNHLRATPRYDYAPLNTTTSQDVPLPMPTCHAFPHLCLPTAGHHNGSRGTSTYALLSLITSPTTEAAIGKESRNTPRGRWGGAV